MPAPHDRIILDVRSSSDPEQLLREALEAGLRPLVVVMPPQDTRVLDALQAWGIPWQPTAERINGASVVELLAP